METVSGINTAAPNMEGADRSLAMAVAISPEPPRAISQETGMAAASNAAW